MPFADPEKEKEYHASYRMLPENRIKAVERSKIWRDNNYERYLARQKKCYQAKKLRQYGLTKSEFDAMVRRQKGKCAICKDPFEKKIKGTTKIGCIDHCHKTGRVRELLCSPCNWALGNMEDNIGRLKSAVRYLKKHQKKAMLAAC